jgi:uncharacterized Tic20 family protein
MNQAPENKPTGTALTWAMTAHLSALGLYLGMPLVNLLFPYLIWRWKRAHSDYVATHALAALNFQITVTIAGLAVTLIAIFIPLAWILVVVVFTANIIYIGMAADHAKSGLQCRYPLNFRWIH